MTPKEHFYDSPSPWPQKNLAPRVCDICGIPVLTGSINRLTHEGCRYTKARKWSKNNAARSSREYRESYPEQTLVSRARQRASNCKVPFNLTAGSITIPDLCPVFKVPMVKHTRYTPSIDRTIPELGYVEGNVSVMSFKANAMKQDATIDELKMFARWVFEEYGA